MNPALTVRLSKRLAQVSVVRVPAGAPAGGGSVANAATQTERAASSPVAAPPAPDLAKLMEKERNDLKLAAMALQSGVQRLQRMQQEMLAQSEEQLRDLAISIAEKVLMQEIQAERYRIDPIVQEALKRLSARSDLVVRMHPEDLSRCEMAKSPQETAGAGDVRFVADPTVKRAECIVEAQEGYVVSSIETNLGALAQALRSPD